MTRFKPDYVESLIVNKIEGNYAFFVQKFNIIQNNFDSID